MSQKPPFMRWFLRWKFMREIEEPVERAAGELNLDGLFDGRGCDLLFHVSGPDLVMLAAPSENQQDGIGGMTNGRAPAQPAE